MNLQSYRETSTSYFTEPLIKTKNELSLSGGDSAWVIPGLETTVHTGEDDDGDDDGDEEELPYPFPLFLSYFALGREIRAGSSS